MGGRLSAAADYLPPITSEAPIDNNWIDSRSGSLWAFTHKSNDDDPLVVKYRYGRREKH